MSLKARCKTRARYDERWWNLGMECDCLEHRLSHEWANITGDSLVVDVEEVDSAGRAGSYLAKYIAKDFLTSDIRKGAGFARAWSRSRSWPVDDMMLLYTKVNRVLRGQRRAWRSVRFGKKEMNVFPEDGPLDEQVEASSMHELGSKVGTDLGFYFASKRERIGLESSLRKGMRRILC